MKPELAKWVAAGSGGLLFAAFIAAHELSRQSNPASEQPTPFLYLAAAVASLASSAWVWFDRLEARRPPLAWSVFVFPLPPLTMPIYFFRAKGLAGLLFTGGFLALAIACYHLGKIVSHWAGR